MQQQNHTLLGAHAELVPQRAPQAVDVPEDVAVGDALVAALDGDAIPAALHDVPIDEMRRDVERVGDAEVGGGDDAHDAFTGAEINVADIIEHVARIIPLAPAQPRPPKPEWLKVRAPGSPSYLRLKSLMRELNLHTVCEEAQCPNIGECWHHGTATFMILGDICTRACAYCAVAHGRPHQLDPAEPARVGEAIRALNLSYVVITSVDRDDLADGGASVFADTVRETRARLPECRLEVLIPDFQGDESALRTVLDARPDILNHNTETVPRLYRMARSGGRYERTLQLLERSRSYAPDIPTKTGVMVGLGEEHDELVATFKDLREVGCGILTIGQYLRPSAGHAPMVRYYHPDEFAELKTIALELGFVHVESGPLVRSSYHAHETADAYQKRGRIVVTRVASAFRRTAGPAEGRDTAYMLFCVTFSLIFCALG